MIKIPKEERTFKRYLTILGVTEEELYKVMDEHAVVFKHSNVRIGPSSIHGIGCFTATTFKQGEKIGDVWEGKNRTELGRFINHSSSPNIYLKQNSFYALKDLKINEEILTDYIINFQTLLNETAE